METKKLLRQFLVLFFVLCSFAAFPSKGNDTIPADTAKIKIVPLKPWHRNVIKFNPTPMMLLANTNNITFSYERLVKDNQSICIQAGYLLFPRLYTDTLLHLIAFKGGEKYGVNLSADYRFYPMKRNRRPAPDGLYLGGYISYYGFSFNNPFDIVVAASDNNGALNGKINIMNIGMELGYQFVFWKRFTLDMLMFGPSVSYYNRSMKIQGALDQEQIQIIDEELAQKLMEKYPALKELFSNEDVTLNGTRTSLSFGFRYSLQIGFHF